MPVYDRKRKAACGVDIATYETHCAQGLAREEFSWGLYFHRGRQDGIWLELRPNHNYAVDDDGDDDDTECRPRPTPFKLHRHRLSGSPRLQCQVVGIIRVLRVPFILCDELTWYLDWLALESYGTASRTFIWTTSMYLRTWHHIAQIFNNPMLAYGAQFDVNLFLREALRFSYENADYSIGGQLPRPIITSAYGTELDLPDETNVKQRLMLAPATRLGTARFRPRLVRVRSKLSILARRGCKTLWRRVIRMNVISKKKGKPHLWLHTGHVIRPRLHNSDIFQTPPCIDRLMEKTLVGNFLCAIYMRFAIPIGSPMLRFEGAKKVASVLHTYHGTPTFWMHFPPSSLSSNPAITWHRYVP
ncbi:hypothetical protein E4U40_001343 [Claviceps sp. LM458 group G5]|nr:hypothetical protein E4U40_001343 [Claviceps sp. LM458 group G5]